MLRRVELQAVYRDLLDPDGGELVLAPAAQFVPPGADPARVTFGALSTVAGERGAVALGVLHADGRLRLGPNRMEPLALRPGDSLALFADTL